MSDLQVRIQEWLLGTGFPLEIRAASAFRAAGFEVRQASTYSDPQSEKGREVDVLAVDPDLYGIIEISAVIECKASSSPWVVLVSDATLKGYNRLHAMCVSSTAAKSAVFEQVAKAKKKPMSLDLDDRCGYGVRQAFSKEHDPAYAACVNVLKASSAIAQDRESKVAPRLSFAFPVLVVESPVFECELDSSGNLSLQEVTSSIVLFSAYLPEPISSCIRVVRSSHLREVARQLKAAAVELRTFLGPKEEEVRSGWVRRADA